jgi:antitoxin (DNA-binding transcriptional repressor) of toxin-antitoxin stability system
MEDELEDLYIGLDALRVDFSKVADELKEGKWGSVIILRYNKPVGVMVSFDAYQKLKAKTSVVVLAPPVEVEGKS